MFPRLKSTNRDGVFSRCNQQLHGHDQSGPLRRRISAYVEDTLRLNDYLARRVKIAGQMSRCAATITNDFIDETILT